jgi:uncharacterized protein GlcG (DUF336 family)
MPTLDVAACERLLQTARVSAGGLDEGAALTADAVKTILSGAEAEARHNNWAVSIAVVDPNGDLMGFLKLDGATPSSVQVAQGKARTAAHYAQTDMGAGRRLVNHSFNYLPVDGTYALQGGVPIRSGERVVGAIASSGATSAQDEQIAMAGLAALSA